MGDKVIELREYAVYYGKKKIKYGDIDIYEGEFVGIMGQSGCGKTSLLNSLFSYDFSGSVTYRVRHIFGKDYKNQSGLLYKEVSYMPQFCQNALNPKLTVDEQIKLTLKGNNLKYNYDDIKKIMESLSLKMDVLYKYSNELSGGMKQRVILLLCYLKKPKLLVLDEPSSALDFITLNAMISFLKSIEGRCTIIMVSHNKDLLKKLCERVICLTEDA